MQTFLSSVFEQVDKRHRFTGLLSLVALLYPWVIGMGTKLLLSLLVLPLGAIVLGVNHGLAYVDKHVVKPERCARVVTVDQVNPPAEESGAALCLALDSEEGREVTQGRLVVATQKAYVVQLADKSIRLFNADRYTPRPISFVATVAAIKESS